jgi:hypothetical protein
MAELINNEELVADVARSAGLQRKKDRVEVVIHTMPKRFLQQPNQSAEKSKHHGLYIVLIGGVFLMGMLGALYYYLSTTSKKEPLIKESEDLKVAQNNVQTPVESAGEEAKTATSTTVGETTENNANQEIIDVNSLAPGDNASPIATVGDELVNLDQTASDTAEFMNDTPEQNEALVLKAAVDADTDGLSDIEEVILDSNPQVADSDGDGFGDLAELLKLYNPAGGGKIIVNPNIEKYTNGEFAYSLYYPKSWLTSNALGNNSVVFQLGGDEFIQILIEPKFEQATLDDWYKNQFGVDYIDAGKKIFKPGWAGIKSQDNLVAYLYNPNHDYLVVASYSPGKDTLKYQNLFDMMVSSFEFAK